MFDIKGVFGGFGILRINREKINFNEGIWFMKYYDKKVYNIVCVF